MKLLFDQNLSPALSRKIADLFPGSAHTELVGLGQSDDRSIWEYCRREGFIIVSKDNDFGALSMQRGAPPKVIWIGLGNCTTADVEDAIRHDFDTIRAFETDPDLEPADHPTAAATQLRVLKIVGLSKS